MNLDMELDEWIGTGLGLVAVGAVMYLLVQNGVSGLVTMVETAPWKTLATAAAVLFLAIFGLYLVLERDASRAARRTSERSLGAAVGAGGVGLAAIAEGVHVLAELPAILITLLGIGSIIAGISWELFGAVALLGYIVLAAVRGDY